MFNFSWAARIIITNTLEWRRECVCGGGGQQQLSGYRTMPADLPRMLRLLSSRRTPDAVSASVRRWPPCAVLLNSQRPWRLFIRLTTEGEREAWRGQPLPYREILVATWFLRLTPQILFQDHQHKFSRASVRDVGVLFKFFVLCLVFFIFLERIDDPYLLFFMPYAAIKTVVFWMFIFSFLPVSSGQS